jgi:HemY protein
VIRLIVFLIVCGIIATGLVWLAERPGTLAIRWQDRALDLSLFRAVVILGLVIAFAIMAWAIIRYLWQSPAAVGQYFLRRRQQKGLDALSSGMIAVGAGDKQLAIRYAQQARKTLPNEPLTHLLRAQAAQLSGDRSTSRRIFEAMLSSPDTEQLGLRGLFLEAEREGEREAARQFAERALRLNPRLPWPTEALFELQCRDGAWESALETLSSAKANNLIDKATADRRRAVLLTAQAQAIEEDESEKAMSLALEAHRLAPDLVPAAAISARVLASRGNPARVAKIVETTWQRSPHPELATAYAYSRLGDSPRDRLERARRLVRMAPHSIESPIALATAALEAKSYEEARQALETLTGDRQTKRVCSLMARIEAEDGGNRGRAREWLARIAGAPRDPVWTADGVAAERWAPISPVTGRLDAFEWRVPTSPMERSDSALLASDPDNLMAIPAPRGAGEEPDSSGATSPAPAARTAPRASSATGPATSTPSGSTTDSEPPRSARAGSDAPPTVEIIPMPARSVPASASGPQRPVQERGGESSKVIEILIDGDDTKVHVPDRASGEPSATRETSAERTTGSGKA